MMVEFEVFKPTCGHLKSLLISASQAIQPNSSGEFSSRYANQNEHCKQTKGDGIGTRCRGTSWGHHALHEPNRLKTESKLCEEDEHCTHHKHDRGHTACNSCGIIKIELRIKTT